MIESPGHSRSPQVRSLCSPPGFWAQVASLQPFLEGECYTSRTGMPWRRLVVFFFYKWSRGPAREVGYELAIPPQISTL